MISIGSKMFCNGLMAIDRGNRRDMSTIGWNCFFTKLTAGQDLPRFGVEQIRGKIGDVGVCDLRGSGDSWGRYHIECVLTPRLTRP